MSSAGQRSARLKQLAADSNSGGRLKKRKELAEVLRAKLTDRYGSKGDEAVLIKCWDSYGRDFAPHHATPGLATVPATFALHSGFEDPATPLTLNRIESLTP